MKKDLQDKLYEKYPKIFAQKDWDKTQTCMCWGIECGDGWYKLIDQLCKYLQFHIDKNDHPQVEATQVKEKFGGLRFYTSGADKFQAGAIRFTEHLSLSICETCGSMDGKGQAEGGRARTICPKCFEEKV